ncbi:MAG: WD40 repeat domain-containing protein [Planctomycetaceae bacterium]
MSQATPTIIDPAKTHLLLEYKHDRPLTACHWEPKSRYVFFGAEDNLIHRYDPASQAVTPLSAHDSWIRSFGSSLDGELLYSGGYDGRLIWWPAAAEKPEPIRVVEAHQGWIRALAVSPNGAYIATCGNDLLVNLWDAASGALVRDFAGHISHIYNVIFSPDSATMYSCDLKGFVKAWNVATGEARDVATVEALHKYDTTFRADIGGARSIALRSDGAQLALGGIINVTNAFAGVGEVAVALVNVADGKIDVQLESKDKTKGATWGVAHHPNGFWTGLTGGGGGGWFFFWKGDEPHEFFKFQMKAAGRGMSLSPDQSQLAVAHSDRHLRTYALYEKPA